MISTLFHLIFTFPCELDCLKTLFLFQFLQNFINFELCPNQASFLNAFSFNPPSSFPKDRFNQLMIIPFSQIVIVNIRWLIFITFHRNFFQFVKRSQVKCFRYNLLFLFSFHLTVKGKKNNVKTLHHFFNIVLVHR